MNKFVILLACMASLVTAGVLDHRRMLDDNSAEQIGNDQITRMSRDELLRQKFLLDVLQHVQQPLANEELLALANTLIVDQNKYTEQIDDEMLHVIELCRQHRLLGKQQVFTIADEDHLRQMVGLYRMLVHASDWDTFQRNAAFARKHINGVLLVNALLLAVRDRDDTQTLVVPAIHEILPEIYWGNDLVQKVRTIDMDALVTDTETLRPSLMDMIGLGRRTRLMHQKIAIGKSPIGVLERAQLWMPWHEMHMEMGVRKNAGERAHVMTRNENKLVLPVVQLKKSIEGRDVDLITEDVALKSFMHGLINNLILREDERRNGQIDVNDRVAINQMGGRIGGRVDLERNVAGSLVERERLQNRWDNNNMGDINGRVGGSSLERDNTERRLRNLQDNDDDHLPTTNVNSERLLHVGRRSQQADVDNLNLGIARTLGNERQRFMNTVQGKGIGNDGRRMGLGLESDDQQDDITGHRRLRQINADDDDNDSRMMRGGMHMRNVQNTHTLGGRQSILNDQLSSGGDRMQAWERDDQLLNRGIGGMGDNRRGMHVLDNLPTTNINDERLLHVNQRRLNQRLNLGVNQQQLGQDESGERGLWGAGRQQNTLKGRHVNDDDDDHVNMRGNNWGQQQWGRDDSGDHGIWGADHQQNTMMGRRLNGDDDDNVNTRGNNRRQQQWNQDNTLMGRRTNDDDDDDNVNMRGSTRRTQGDIRQGMLNRNNDDDMGVRNIGDMGLRRSSIDNERLLKVNRRRLNRNNDMNMNEDILRSGDVEDLRRVKLGLSRGMDDIGTEHDDRLHAGLRGANEQDMQQRRGIVRENDDGLNMGIGMLQRLPRSLRSGNDRHNMQQMRAGEVLVHNLQQLLARINIDRIALGMKKLRDDAVTDTDMNTHGINEGEQRLNNVIQQELRRVTGVHIDINAYDQSVVNGIIGELLIGGKVGDLSILNMLREIIRQTEDIEGIQTLTHLGVGVTDDSNHHLLRRLVQIIDGQRQQLGSYQREDLQLQGVHINDVVVDRLHTYVEVSDADLINLLDSHLTLNQQRMQKMVVARQQRLNHKSFNINIDLNSDRNQRVVVRTILMPKIDGNERELETDEQRLNALVLDATIADLQVGRNVVKRKSRDIAWTARDVTPYSQIYQRVMLAINDNMDVSLERVSGQNCRFPHRLLLPRGRFDGLPMQLLVIVTPVEGMDRNMQKDINDRSTMCGIGIGSQNLDRLPLGFPLDRKIDSIQQLVSLSNVLLKDVNIYHNDRLRMDN